MMKLIKFFFEEVSGEQFFCFMIFFIILMISLNITLVTISYNFIPPFDGQCALQKDITND